VLDPDEHEKSTVHPDRLALGRQRQFLSYRYNTS
jgi:hypothetical protein